jgi:hypothetical protein
MNAVIFVLLSRLGYKVSSEHAASKTTIHAIFLSYFRCFFRIAPRLFSPVRSW